MFFQKVHKPQDVLIAEVRLFIVGIQSARHRIFGKRFHDPRINKETVDRVAVKSHFSASRLFFKEIFELETAHQVLQEKIAYVQLGGRGSRILRLFHPFIVISRNGVFHPADTVFLVHLPDFFLDIGQGVIRNFKKFRVFSKPFDVFGCNFFAVTDPQLGIIDRILTVFVIKELHFITAVNSIYNIIQQKVKKNLTKKYRISAAPKDFILLQVLKTRVYPNNVSIYFLSKLFCDTLNE